MKYCQLDSISSLDPGHQIVAQRTLRADEEYLLDHFPRFPVMPGVMMLESLHQAAMWLVQVTTDFSHPVVVLKEAKGVKFGDFLSPNETLEITAKITKTVGDQFFCKAAATKDGKTTVSARLVMECCSLSNLQYTDSADADQSDGERRDSELRDTELRDTELRDTGAGDACRRLNREQFESLFKMPVPSISTS